MRIPVIILFLFITPLLIFANARIDSVEIVKRKAFMRQKPNDLKFLTKDTLLSVGDDFYVRLSNINENTDVVPNITDFRLVPDIGNFNSISQAGDDTYIAGDKGTIVKFFSPHNFEIMNSNTEQDIKLIENCNGSVVFIDSNNTVNVTSDFIHFKTHKFDNVINDIMFSNNNIYLAGQDGMAYLSTDLGKAWTEHKLDSNGKNLIHISISPGNKIFFSGENILKTDLNLESIVKSKINFEKEYIAYVDKFYPLNDSLACAYLGNTGVNTFLVYFKNSNIDSVYNIPNFVLDPIIPVMTYSTKYEIGCLMKSNHSQLCFTPSTYQDLSSQDQKDFNLPEESQFLYLYDINNDQYVGKIDDNICTFNKGGEILDTFLNESTKTIDNIQSTTRINYWNKDSIICAITNKTLQSGKFVSLPGSSKLLFSTDRGISWDTVSNSHENFAMINKNNSIISYYENDSLYRASDDFGKTWYNINWPRVDGGLTNILIPINHNTHISVPFFWDDPNKISYYKTTDCGKTWNKLTWYEQEGNEIFNNGSIPLAFKHLMPNVALIVPSDNQVYISYDNFESWNKYSEISFTSRPWFGKIQNTSYTFFLDSSFIYICNVDFELEKKIEINLDKFLTDSNRSSYLENSNTLWSTDYNKLYTFKLDQLLSVVYSIETEYQELVAFPNPAKDYIELKRNDISFNLGMIMDYTGKERKIISDINNGIDLKDLESGTYFLILIDDVGNPYRTKFVIAK